MTKLTMLMVNIAFTVLLMGVALSSAHAQSNAPQSPYIVNDATVNLQTITYREASNIFLMVQRHWYDGNRIKVILPPFQSNSFKELAKELGMSSVTYYELLVAKNHSGTVSYIVANSEQSIPIQVGATPFSIGYYRDTIAINAGIGVRYLSAPK